MNKQVSIESALAINARRRRACDQLLVALVCLTIPSVSLFAFSVRAIGESPNAMFVALESMILGLIAGYAALAALKPVSVRLREAFPTWAIEQCDDVVKVHGSVSVTDWRAVEQRLLSTREHLMLAEHPFERFGCTMAAVPATKEHLAAKAHLSTIGFTLR